MHIRSAFISGIVTCLWFAVQAPAQTSALSQPHARIVQSVDESSSVTLLGNVHPLIAAAAASASKPLDDSTPMEHMILHLKADATQEAQLAQLIAQQKDPKSPLYRQYMTPQDFGAQFGVAAADMAKVTAWLQSHGFTIDKLPAGNRSVVFSGTAGQVASAFKTEIRSFSVAGKRHVANVSDPQIPAALASVVGGIVQLHDFQAGHSLTKMTPMSKAQVANPQYNDATGHSLAPADFSTIYNTNPLYSAGIDGTGQSIAVVARSNIALSDIETFRTMFGLPPNDPQVLIVTNDPGQTPGNSTETTLDTEWAGAIAPKATIKVVVGQCTNTGDGIAEAELYAVSHNISPIISVSYGLCEAAMGSSYVAFYNSLWQQAAAQGQSVIVASGDTGAAGCNSQADTSASVTGVNGLCSSPYSTCVGGTQFVEGGNPSQYWLPGNNAANGSATGYIPETVWNESGSNGGSGLLAGGGGASIVFAKPSWQTGMGVPADGKRDVPDVSLSAAQHDGYLIYQYWAGDGGLFSSGGTSFSTPAFAAIVALVNQKTGVRQGLVNPTLYVLASLQAAGGAAVFHDITTGNISVPGVTGFAATPGYDLASGLGSVDAAMLVIHWADAGPSLTLNSSSGTLAVNAGQSTQTTVTANANALNSAVTLAVSGAPMGVTASFASATIPSPGSGSSALNIATTVSTKPGSYTITITGTGGGQTATLSLPLTIGAPTFSLVPDKSSLILNLGGSGPVTIAATAQAGFSAALTLAVSGAPAGVTATLTSKAVAAPGTGSVVLNVATSNGATPGTYPLTVTGQGGGRTQTAVINLVIPTFAVTTTADWFRGSPGGTVTIPVTINVQSGFNSPIALSATNYLPSGVTPSFSPATVSGSGALSSTLTLSIASNVPIGAYPFMIYGKSGSITQQDYVWVLVGVAGSCTLWVYDSTMTSFTLPVTAGQSTTGKALCLWPKGVFNGPLSVSFSGLPAGLTAQALQQLVPGGTASTIQVNAAQNMAAGPYNFNIVGNQGTFTTKFAVNVAVTANSFGLTAATSGLTITQGTTGQTSVASMHKGAFNSAVSLSWSGLPTGVSAALAKSAFAAPGDGTTVTIFTATANATPGTYTVILTGTGGGQTQTMPVTLTIAPPSCTLGVTYPSSATALTLSAGQTSSVQASCTSAQGVFSAPLKLSLTGARTGVTAQAAAATIAAGAKVAVQIATPQSMAAASFKLSLTATSGSFTQSVPISVEVSASNFTLSAAQSAMSITAGTSGQISVSSIHHGLFSSPVSLSWAGLPGGVTASLARSVFAAPGDGTAATSFAAAANTAPGTYAVTLTATGGGLTQSVPVTLTIAPAPTCTLGTAYPASLSSLAVAAGQSASAQVSCSAVQGVFSSPLTLSLTGMPSGVTAKAATSTMPAGGSVTVTVSAAQGMPASNFTLLFTAASGNFTTSLPIAVSVSANSFSVTAGQSAMTIKAGTAGQASITAAHIGVFNSPLSLSWAMPAGVTASLSKTMLAAPGDGTAVTTLTASTSAKPGVYTATLTATGGGQTRTVPVTLTIAAK